MHRQRPPDFHRPVAHPFDNKRAPPFTGPVPMRPTVGPPTLGPAGTPFLGKHGLPPLETSPQIHFGDRRHSKELQRGHHSLHRAPPKSITPLAVTSQPRRRSSDAGATDTPQYNTSASVPGFKAFYPAPPNATGRPALLQPTNSAAGRGTPRSGGGSRRGSTPRTGPGSRRGSTPRTGPGSRRASATQHSAGTRVADHMPHPPRNAAGRQGSVEAAQQEMMRDNPQAVAAMQQVHYMQYMYALDLHRRACEDQEQVGRAQVLSAQDKYFRVLELQLQMQNAEVREHEERNWIAYREDMRRLWLEEEGLRGVVTAAEDSAWRDLMHAFGMFTGAVAVRMEAEAQEEEDGGEEQEKEEAPQTVQQQWQAFAEARAAETQQSVRQMQGFSRALHQQLEYTTVDTDYDTDVPYRPAAPRTPPPRRVPEEKAAAGYHLELEERQVRLEVYDDAESELEQLNKQARQERLFLSHHPADFLPPDHDPPAVVPSSAPSTPDLQYQQIVWELPEMTYDDDDRDDDDDTPPSSPDHPPPATHWRLDAAQESIWSKLVAPPPEPTARGVPSTAPAASTRPLAAADAAATRGATSAPRPRPREDARWRLEMRHRWQDFEMKVRHGDEDVGDVLGRIVRLQRWARQMAVYDDQFRLRTVLEHEEYQRRADLLGAARGLSVGTASADAAGRARGWLAGAYAVLAFQGLQRALAEPRQRSRQPSGAEFAATGPTMGSLMGFATAPKGSYMPLYEDAAGAAAEPPKLLPPGAALAALDIPPTGDDAGGPPAEITYADLLSSSGQPFSGPPPRPVAAVAPAPAPTPAPPSAPKAAPAPPSVAPAEARRQSTPTGTMTVKMAQSGQAFVPSKVPRR